MSSSSHSQAAPRRRLRRSQASSVLVLTNDIVDSLAALWNEFRSYRRVAKSISITVGGKPYEVPVTVKIRDDQPAPLNIVFHDAEGAVTTNLPGPLTVSVDNTLLALLAPDNSSVSAVPGWDTQPSHVFHVTASAGSLTGTSDDVEIDPTVATSEQITVTATG